MGGCFYIYTLPDLQTQSMSHRFRRIANGMWGGVGDWACTCSHGRGGVSFCAARMSVTNLAYAIVHSVLSVSPRNAWGKRRLPVCSTLPNAVTPLLLRGEDGRHCAVMIVLPQLQCGSHLVLRKSGDRFALWPKRELPNTYH